jgi:hypothetical protein
MPSLIDGCSLHGTIHVRRDSDMTTIGELNAAGGSPLSVIAYGDRDRMTTIAMPDAEKGAVGIDEAVRWILANTGIPDMTDDPDILIHFGQPYRVLYRVAGGGVIAAACAKGQCWSLSAFVGADEVARLRSTNAAWALSQTSNLHRKPDYIKSWRRACERLGDTTLGSHASAHERLLREEQKAAEAPLWDTAPPLPPVPFCL